MSRKALIALTAPSVVLVAAIGLWAVRPATALLWLLGAALGVVLHRTRFCVAAAFRDSYLFGDMGPARAVLLALGLSSLGFAWLQYRSTGVEPGNIYPITIGTAAGAVLFGMGFIPAGGCAITTLVRLGEGHLRFVWTLLGLVIGALLGAWQYGWWHRLGGTFGPVHLPDVLGWGGALAVQGALLGAVWLLLRWWERRGGAR